MDIFLSVIAFIFIFSLLVLIHEWGHFFTARRAGIKVEEFGFGLPPRIWGIKRGDVLYSLNAIPFGGFVKLLGEDSSDPDVVKNKKSFIAKPPRVRMLVVCAGVIMNFLLAFVLLTVGFTFGIQPLILNSDDLLQNIQQDRLVLEQGVVIKEVVKGSIAEEMGLLPNDRILALDGRPIITEQQLQVFDPKRNTTPAPHQVLVERNDIRFQLNLTSESNDIGIRLHQSLFLPRMVVAALDEGSLLSTAGMEQRDIVLAINDVPVYFAADVQKNIQDATTTLEFRVLRNWEVQDIVVDIPSRENVVVAKVLPDSPAEKAGIQSADYIVSINGVEISTLQDINEKASIEPGASVEIVVRRNNERIPLTAIADDDGRIGVVFSLLNRAEGLGATYYQTDVPTSVLEIKDVRYPFWEAPGKALQEIGRLSVLTVEMFTNTIRSLLTQFSVPEGISGPVGIAHMTYVFVQEGFLSLIRFAALLSISLAIINVLPVPALDGGRLFFIIVEVLRGKRLDGRLEGIVHGIGFLLLLIFIFFLVYNDIVRLLF